jgi:hypothetical protein
MGLRTPAEDIHDGEEVPQCRRGEEGWYVSRSQSYGGSPIYLLGHTSLMYQSDMDLDEEKISSHSMAVPAGQHDS